MERQKQNYPPLIPLHLTMADLQPRGPIQQPTPVPQPIPMPNAAYPNVPSADTGGEDVAVSAPSDITQLLTGLPYGMDGQGSIIDQLAQVQTAGLDDQQAGIKALEDRIQQLNKPTPQMDLTPLMALHDTWFGGSLAQNYRRPQTPEEIGKQEAMLQEAVLQAKGKKAATEAGIIQSKYNAMSDLYGRQLSAAAAVQAAKEKAGELRLRRAELTADRRQKEADRRQAEAERRAYREDKDIQELRTKLSHEKEYDVANKVPGAIQPVRDLRDSVLKNGIAVIGPGTVEQDQLQAMFDLVSKDVYGLGALSGPDMGILNKQKGFTGGFGGYMKSLMKNNDTAQFVESLNRLERVLNQRFDKAIGNLERVYPKLKNDESITFLKAGRGENAPSAQTSDRVQQLRDELTKRSATK